MTRARPTARSLLVAGLVAATAAGCGQVDDGGTDPTTSAPLAPAATTAPAAPVTTAAKGAFTAADGRFRAQFPVPPQRVERSGGDITFVFYGSGGSALYIAVGYADYPASFPELKDVRAFLRDRSQEEGTQSMKDTTFLNRPAVDSVRLRVEGGVPEYQHQKAFLVANRMYFLQGSSASPSAPAEYATLLATFALT